MMGKEGAYTPVGRQREEAGKLVSPSRLEIKTGIFRSPTVSDG
jgi:hypothetical protein